MRTIMIFFYLILLITLAIGGVRFILYTIKKIRHKKLPQYHPISNLGKDFTSFANKTKWKRWGITAWIALVIISMVASLTWNINSHYMEKAYFKTSEKAFAYFTSAAPNIIANNQIIDDYGIFSSNIHSDTYKDVDGYHVPWCSYNFGFGTLGTTNLGIPFSSPINSENGYYTQDTGQKIATFFSTKVDYHSKDYTGILPTHDADKISKLSNHVAEVAVTFNQSYSYNDIQKMIPKNLLINWYWIGYNNPTSAIVAAQGNWYGLMSNSSPTKTNSNSQLNGKLDDKSYASFIKNLQVITQSQQLIINNFNLTKDALKQSQKYPSLKTAKFSGVILTGRTKNFENLDKNSWVYATNVGVTTEIRPDIPPIK